MENDYIVYKVVRAVSPEDAIAITANEIDRVQDLNQVFKADRVTEVLNVIGQLHNDQMFKKVSTTPELDKILSKKI